MTVQQKPEEKSRENSGAFRYNWKLMRSNVFLRFFFFTDRSECPFVAFRRIWTLHHPCHPLNPNSLEWQIHCYTAGPDSLGIKNQRAINTMLKSYSKYGFLPLKSQNSGNRKSPFSIVSIMKWLNLVLHIVIWQENWAPSNMSQQVFKQCRKCKIIYMSLSNYNQLFRWQWKWDYYFCISVRDSSANHKFCMLFWYLSSNFIFSFLVCQHWRVLFMWLPQNQGSYRRLSYIDNIFWWGNNF